MRSPPVGLLLLAAALTAPTRAAGEGDPVTGARTTLSADLVARAAPEGLMLFTGVARRWSRADEDLPVLRGRYLEVGATVGANPAYAQGAVHVESVPLAPLQLRTQYDVYGFFGRANALVRFPSRAAPFGDGEMKALAGTEASGMGQRLLLSPVLRMRIGRVVLRSQTDLAWFALPRTPAWTYESEYDTLLADRDLVISNRSTMLFELWHGGGQSTLLAGPGYELTHAARADITRQRAEGVLFFSPRDGVGSLARLRVFAVAGVNLVDRNRRHEPFAVVGTGADLDL
jgi:hypothetical protein